MDPNPNGLHTKRKQQRIGIGATSSVTLDSPYVLFHSSILPTEKFSFISSDQSKMIKVVVSKAVIKGYHIFRIRPSPLLDLQVTKEYGNKHDKYACLIWVPELGVNTTKYVERCDRCQKGRKSRNHHWLTHSMGPTGAVIMLLGASEFSSR